MKLTKYSKKLKFTYLFGTWVTLLLGVLLFGEYVTFEEAKENRFHIFVNATEVGTVNDPQEAKEWVQTARKEIARKSPELVFLEVEFSYTGEAIDFGEVDEEEVVKANIKNVLEASVLETLQRSYTVKVNEYMTNLSTEAEVKQLLEAAIGKYDTYGRYGIALEQDPKREFNMLQAKVVDSGQVQATIAQKQEQDPFVKAGIGEQMDIMFAEYEPERELDFEDYELGIQQMNFKEEIEIVEVYLPEYQIQSVENAVQELVEEQEQQVIYEVQSGDTLSEIAIKVNIPMDDIIAMNASLENERSVLQIGQELIITVPEPELSVVRQEVNYYEEIYNADIIYIDVDDWYTYQTEVVQQPSAGFRRVVVNETFENKELINREILKEKVEMEAVPKIVKRGTIVPPTYIKPLSGGRSSSGFGPRKAPTKGASTYHKGQDWATPVGTPIYASSGGTVAKAGWGSGYGYVVYINHTDGRQTRYAHLSKVLVKAGQTVKQGEKIALSGNTGISSGPHLHFEMLIGGKQVNPLKYLE
ncbi:MAG: peptidoglycan DD-metalloendopeptidase family protein [Lachnospiraceae bacterium]|nr:peptidoglycan DD-metalloendopeptidase family protein [Lachnospiraceae bacterium]